MADGGTPTRNAREDGDDPERAKLEKKATKRLHAAFRAVQSALFPRSDQIVNPEVVTLRLHGAWGMVHDEVVGMVTEAALMGARFAFSYNTNDLQANEPTITSSWELINEEVLRYVMGDTFQMGEGYATALTQQLLQTSERQIKEAIAAWTRSGDPLPALIRTLETTALSRSRAELIATTEVTRAYAEAARLTWAQGGVIETMRWQTANDEWTCDVCRPLNGQTTAVVGGTFSLVDEAGTVTMTMRQPPAHPRCRCWLSPVAPSFGSLKEERRP